MVKGCNITKEDLQHFMWRWQFLRRDPEYRTDWSSVENKLSETLRAKWGFRGPLPDPRDNAPNDLFFDDMVGSVNRDGGVPYQMVFDLRREITPQIERARCILLAAQAAYGLKPNHTHEHTKQWPKQLRALDAHEQGAGWTEIARVLQTNKTGGSREGRRLLEAAVRTQRLLTRMAVFDPAVLKPKEPPQSQ